MRWWSKRTFPSSKVIYAVNELKFQSNKAQSIERPKAKLIKSLKFLSKTLKKILEFCHLTPLVGRDGTVVGQNGTGVRCDGTVINQ